VTIVLLLTLSNAGYALPVWQQLSADYSIKCWRNLTLICQPCCQLCLDLNNVSNQAHMGSTAAKCPLMPALCQNRMLYLSSCAD